MSEAFPISPEPCSSTSRRRIQGHRKSRGGCFTCKARRKKCDEGRPSCRRCVDTGRRCDGYPVGLAGIPLADGGVVIKGYGWTFLEYFRFQTIPIFSAYYDTTLWDVMLAQTSVSQMTLQYTAVAFAATHYEYETRRRYPTRRLEIASQENAAAMLYIDAVSKARQALAATSSRAEAVRIGFMMSLMLAATESLRNSAEGVTMHLANGLKIAFSRGYEIVKSSWKPCEPEMALKDAVLAFIRRLKVIIEEELDLNLGSGRDTDAGAFNTTTQKSTGTTQSPHPLCILYQDISSLIDHTVAGFGLPTAVSKDFVHNKTLETVWRRLQHLSLRESKTEHRELRFLRLYRQAAQLLLLCHLEDLTASNNPDLSQSHAHSDSRSNFLKAYFSKLHMIEEQLRGNDTFITHLTPAQLKGYAARHWLKCTLSPSHPMCCTEDPTSMQTIYDEIEQLVMLEEDAIIATGLVPTDATCMEVTSALDRGSVSIRYCIVGSGGKSFEWVETKASLWKPAVFKCHQVD